MDYYIYVYLNPIKKGDYKYGAYSFEYEPFYIGKGRRYRDKHHLTPKALQQDHPRTNIINEIISVGLFPIIERVNINLNEDIAFSIEKELVVSIGRLEDSTGPLTNLAKGGKGGRGNIKPTPETIEKRVSQMRGENHPFFNKKRDNETCDQISNTLKGITVSSKTKSKLSAIFKGKPQGKKERQPVIVFNIEGIQLYEFKTTYEAACTLDCNRSRIREACKTNKLYKNMIWKLKNKGEVI